MANIIADNVPAVVFRPGTSDSEIEAAALRAIKRRKQQVLSLQIGIFVAVVALWQLSSNLLWIDPFFYSSPSDIIFRLYDWAVNGTSEGSL
jgi:NitT/TauT family transport system permease protein